jgi:oligopeptide/dipeptide ABC transporter ATP-binding protein
MAHPLLVVEDLKMYFPVYGGVLRRKVAQVFAVDGVSFAIRAGETLGLVGESGCGKTTVGRTLLRLYRPTGGKVHFDGRSMMTLDRAALQTIRRDMQIIFQDPFDSLNARQTIQEILEEPFRIHRIGSPEERRQRVRQLLERVGLPGNSLTRFPHEFSGGQRQRIGIARAIALEPRLVICDEPVSALDVSIQSQIINLLLELQREMGLTYLFIAHDLAVVKHISDHIAVMYLGRIVEYAAAEVLYREPRHPYTQALISAIPVADPDARKKRQVLSGDVPSPINPPSGCHFRTRCPYTIDRCRNEVPALRPTPDADNTSHLAACHRMEEIRASG